MYTLEDLIRVTLFEQAIKQGGGKWREDEEYDIAPPRAQASDSITPFEPASKEGNLEK